MGAVQLDARNRSAALDQAEGASYDLIVVGGGINGAGIANDASLRGLKVLLLEQRDLAFGTSSRSSKLIHGGLRYLEHYQFKLVFEGTNERAALRKIAPHLVRPLLFTLPVYENARHPLWKVDIGLWLYDGLSLFKAEKRHVTVRSPKRMLEREPLLNPDGLTGGIVYYDCATDDARLTLENALAAASRGAQVITRAKVVGIEGLHGKGDHPVEVTFRDELSASGRTVTARARGVVNATGVWSDRVRELAEIEGRIIRPTKGVHLVVPHERLAVHHAAALLTPHDGRVFFAIPWQGRTVIGTTDTDEVTEPSELRCERADVDYLLEAANASFPSVDLRPDDIIATWVGLRPLIHVETAHASDVPREHQVFKDGRMLTIAGGKLTTYRRMAAEAVDAVCEMIRARVHESATEGALLPGAIGLDEDFDDLAARIASQSGLPEDVASRLANVYGSRAGEVAAYASRDPQLRERITPDRDVILAEVAHAVETELAVCLEDVLVRRTPIALTAEDQGLGTAERVADVMAASLGWDGARKRQELDRYEQTIALTRAFRAPAPRNAKA